MKYATKKRIYNALNNVFIYSFVLLAIVACLRLIYPTPLLGTIFLYQVVFGFIQIVLRLFLIAIDFVGNDESA